MRKEMQVIFVSFDTSSHLRLSKANIFVTTPFGLISKTKDFFEISKCYLKQYVHIYKINCCPGPGIDILGGIRPQVHCNPR